MALWDQTRPILLPPPDRHAGEWAEEHYRFSTGDPESGRYNLERVPIWSYVFECAHNPRVSTIDIVTGAQMGKTTALLAIAGHRADDGPRVPCIFVGPSKELTQRIAERFMAMVDLAPGLFAKMSKGRKARTFSRWFAGVRTHFAWAGSKMQLRSDPAGLAIADEIDTYPDNVEGEGHPLTLIEARTKNYINRLIVRTSTPTIDGASAVQTGFLAGSRYIRQWQCPDCNDWYQPLPEQMVWPDGCDPETAEREGRMACPLCGSLLDDEIKPHLLAGARWWPYDQNDDGDLYPCAEWRDPMSHVSFWATGVFSPWLGLGELRRRLRTAQINGANELISELNTYWGVWYKETGDRPAWERVRAHTSNYAKGEAPLWVQGVCMAVDVQQQSLIWSVYGFGESFRHALIDWGEIHGNPELDETWAVLATFQNKRYGKHPILRCLVDSGYKPGYDIYQRPEHVVYRFCRRLAGWAYAYKGDSRQRDSVRVSKSQRDGILYLVNPDHYKVKLYSDIRSDEANFVVPQDVPDDVCKQLTSEALHKMPNGNLVWRRIRGQPNHLLDCHVMALAQASILNWQHFRKLYEAPTANERKPRVAMSGFQYR